MSKINLVPFETWIKRNPELSTKTRPCWICQAQPEEAHACPICFGSRRVEIAPEEYHAAIERDLKTWSKLFV